MIGFDFGDKYFGCRVVGVALHEGRVLLHRTEDEDFWTLPGGRVEILETFADALVREMQEEIGVTVEIERLVWVVENFFPYQGRRCHEVSLFFLISFPDGAAVYEQTAFVGDEQGLKLLFEWFPLESLDSIRLLPSFLSTALCAIPDQLTHISHSDWE